MPLTTVFMDAGQGDATLLVYPDNSLVLVDCGCKKNGDVVLGEIRAVLNRYLAVTGGRLRALVLTHPDGDHYNLVNALIVQQHVVVGTVFVGGRVDDYAGISAWIKTQNWTGFDNQHCSAAVQPALSLAGRTPATTVAVRVLAANAGPSAAKRYANPNSVVLLVTHLDVNLFLMGDSTATTEQLILTTLDTPAARGAGGPTRLQQLLDQRHTVLKVGHHGSLTSSSDAWLQRIRPELAFISSDTRSFSGVSLPRKAIVDRLAALGTIYQYPAAFRHQFVQYNDATQRHEAVATAYGMFTTLHLLTWPTHDRFVAYGTSWYYGIGPQGTEVMPACGWQRIDTAY